MSLQRVSTSTVNGITTAVYNDANAVAAGTSVTQVTVVLSTSATVASDVGNYTIAITSNAVPVSPATTLNFTNLATPVAGVLTITPAPISISGVVVADKTYNQSTAANITSGGTLSGVLNGDASTAAKLSINTSGAAANFATANVARDGSGNVIAQAVTISGVTLSGSKAANYYFAQPSGVTATINPLTLVVSGTTAANQVYSGSAATTISNPGSLSGVLTGDTVTLDSSLATASFASPNVAVVNGSPASQSVTIAGMALAGSSAGNYAITQPTNVSATITPKPLSVTGTTVADKVYDGTIVATITNAGSLSGVVGSDDVSVLNSGSPAASGTAVFNSANVNATQATTITGMALTGSAASNYTLTQPSGTTAAITAKALTISGTTVNNKVYDSTTVGSINAVGSLQGLVLGDVVTINSGSATANFASADVAYSGASVTSQSVTIAGMALAGAAAGNYTVTQPTGVAATITPKSLIISGATATTSKVYDATNIAAVTSSGSLTSGAASATDGKFYTSDAMTISGALTASYNTADVATANSIGFDMSALQLAGLSSAKAKDYVLTVIPAVSGVITPKALTMSGLTVASSKVYDGTTSAIVSGTPALAAVEAIGVGNSTDGKSYVGDSVAITGTAAGAYNAATVAAANAVSYSGLSLTGSQASNYTLTIQAASAATITPATLTVIGVSANSKSYDTTATATVNTSNAALLGAVSADANNSGKLALVTSGVAGIFASPNVAYSGNAVISQAITISGLTLSGTSAGNYTLVQPSATGTINPLTITITASSNGKAYDGLVAAPVTLTTSNSIALADIASTNLAVAYTSANFANANVVFSSGNPAAQAISVSGISLTGSAAKNYSFNTTANTTGIITPATLTIAAANDSKVYGDTSTAGGVTYTSGVATGSVGYTVSGLIGSDTVSAVTLTSAGGAASANAGTASIVPSAAQGFGNNYTVSYTNGTLTITKAALTITAAAANKVYDSLATYDTSSNALSAYVNLTIAGIKNGESITASASSASFANANVGNAIPVSISGITLSGTTASNYTLNTSATTSANITPAVLTISATGVDKSYNGNNLATVTLGLGSSSGVKGSDASALSFNYGTATFSSANVAYSGNTVIAQPISVSGIVLSGSASGNYTFNTTAATTAKITPAVLTITAAAANKVYDGSTAASVTLSNNAISGDAVAVSYTGATFANASSGNGKVVTVAGLSLSGAAAANYTLSGVTSVATTANISSLGLIITALNDSKVYGGSTTVSGLVYVANGGSTDSSVATTSNTRFTVSGLLNGDSVTGLTLTSVGGLASSTVNGGPYAIIPSAPTGTGVGNYTITYVNGSMTVTPAPVTVSAAASDKVYNGSAAAVATLTPVGFVTTDAANVGLTYASANFASKDVAYNSTPAVINQTVSISGIALSGNAASNYVLSGGTTASASAKITPATLTVIAVASNKVYDATDVATVSLSGNSVNGDLVTITKSAASFASKDVAYVNGAVAPQAVNISGLALTGAQSGNYTLASTSATSSATITPASLSVAAAASDKVYDGTATATVALTVTGLKGSDATPGAYTATYTSATFADPNVGNSIAVAITGLGVSSSLPTGNYTVTNSVAATANITPKALTVTANNVTNMVYGDAYPAFTYSTSGWVNSTEQANAATLLTGVTSSVLNPGASPLGAALHTAVIVPSGGVARNYAMTYVAGDLTINKAVLTATLQDAAKVFGDVNPTPVFAYSGFKYLDTASNSNIVAPTVPAINATAAGQYAMSATGGSSPNYTIQVAYSKPASNNACSGTACSIMTVYQANTLLITMSNADSVVYGVATTPISVTSAVYSSVVNGTTNVYRFTPTLVSGNTWTFTDPIGSQVSTFTVTSNRAQTSSVGNYVSTVTANANGPIVNTTTTGNQVVNFNSVATVDGIVTVIPAALTITAANDSKVYGATTTTTNGVAYTGTSATGGASSFTNSVLVGSDSIASVKLVSSGAVVGASVSNSPYAISISNAQGSGLSNYVITYVDGSMTVTPKTLTVTAAADAKVYGTTTTTAGLAYVGSSVIATNSAGYAVTGLVGADSIYGVTLTTSGALASSTVGGGTLTGANVGKYVVTPSNASGSPGINTNYAISYVDGAMSVTPAALVVTANNDSKVYGSTTTAAGVAYTTGSATGTVGYTTSGLVNGDTVSAVTLSSAGAMATASVAGSSYAIIPSAVSGTGIQGNYTIQYINGVLTVTPKALTVAANAASMSYGDSVLPNLSYSSTGLVNGDTFTGALSTTAHVYSGTAGSASSVGVYPISQGTLSAGSNYSLVYTGANLTVDPVNLTVTAQDRTSVYGVATALGASQFTSTGLVNGDVISSAVLNYNYGTATNIPGTVTVGSYANRVTVGALSGINSANYSITTVAGSLTVTPAPLTVTANDASMTYGAATLPTLVATPVGLVNGDTLSGSLATTATAYNGTAGSASNVGTYAITQGGISAGANYTITFIPGVLTVSPATLTVSGTAQSAVYGAGASLSSSAFTTSGLVNGDTVSSVTALYSGSASVPTTTNAGTYTNAIAISAANGTGLGNYSISYVPATLTITQAPLTIAANNQSITYGANSLPSLTYVATGLVNGDSLSGVMATTATAYSGVAGSASNIGTYPITQGTLAASNNYAVSFSPAVLTVNPASLTITAVAQSATYGAGIANLGANQFTSSGLVNGDAIGSVTILYNGSAAVPATTNAQIYTNALIASNASATVGGSLANYSISYVPANLTINKATLTLVADAKSMTYGAGTLPALTYTASGLVNTDAITGSLATTATAYSGTAGSSSNVGAYPIVIGTISAGANYNIAYTGANVTVNPAALTITANNQTTVYGTALNLGSGAFTGSGLVNGDTVSAVSLLANGNTVTLATTPAGSTPINVSLASGTRLANYSISYIPGTLTVTPKPLTVVANAATMDYADSVLPALTYQPVTGLINGDVMSGALTAQATAYNGLAGSASNAGSYPISQGTLTAGPNYNIAYSGATLTVNKVALTVTAADQNSTYGSVLVLSQSALTTLGLRNGDYVSTATIQYSGSGFVPGNINSGTYSGALALANPAGIGLSNYNVTTVNGNLNVAKANLTVTAAPDAKFVGTADAVGYQGAMYSGLVNGDLPTQSVLGGTLTINRINNGVAVIPGGAAVVGSTDNQAAGSYNASLVASGLNPANYNVTYAPGNFIIVGVNQLLVKTGVTQTVYGSAPVYSPSTMTAAYCLDCSTTNANPSIVNIVGANITTPNNSSYQVAVNDGNGTNALIPVSANTSSLSGSGNVNVGSYAVQSGTPAITSNGVPNFASVLVVGGLNVTPKPVSYTDLAIAGISKVYDGSVYMNNLAVNTTAGFLPGDGVSVTATGNFATKNVGNGIAYTVGITFNDAVPGSLASANYIVGSSLPYTGSNGSITQLNSVTYTGPNTGGAWSNPANWTTTGTAAVGAIPDLANVANVIIPVGNTVVYDNPVAGPVITNVTNNGVLNINLSNATSMPMNISGSGTVTIAGQGRITLTGHNPYTGNTTLNAGSVLIAGSNSAVGVGNMISNGASFGTATGVVLPALNVTGPVTLLSSITTTGAQSYGNLTLATTAVGLNGSVGGNTNPVITLASQSGGNISLFGTVDGAANKTQSLTINAGSGIVTIGDSISSVRRINSLAVTGGSIYILADVLTSLSQTYTGSVLIGDASYLGKPKTVGFLQGTFDSCCVYAIGASQSLVVYKPDAQVDKANIRTLISEDPEVIFNGTVNDVVPDTHTLLVAAITPVSISSLNTPQAINDAAKVKFNGAVGGQSRLYSINAQTISALDRTTSHVGSIDFIDGVATYADQTYRANATFSQSSNMAGGDVVFAVYEPSAYMTFFLPAQTTANSSCTANCGQVNMQDATGGNTLVFNGNARFVIQNASNGAPATSVVDWQSINANTNGDHNWGTRFVQAPALGYIPPAPPVVADFIPPVLTPPSSITVPALPKPLPPQPIVNAAVLRELMDNYVQYSLLTLARNGSVVTISSPEEVALVSGKAKVKKASDADDGGSEPTQSRESGAVCGADKDGKATSCTEE